MDKSSEIARDRNGTILSVYVGAMRYPWLRLKLSIPGPRFSRTRVYLRWNVNERQFRRDGRSIQLATEYPEIHAWLIERLVEFDPGPDGSAGRARWELNQRECV
jgi:hypothetical protein